jgi:MOSC domain-containing protein YiiM
MKLLSIQVGVPQGVNFRGKFVSTGIFKKPVVGPVKVRKFNLEGDGQADLSVHGGLDKAVYAYSFDAYPWWQQTRPNDTFSYGAFGENLLFDHMDEEKMFVGDTYKLGTTLLQVVQPRMPCFKLGIKFNDPTILKTFMKSGRPGVYFRVIEEGVIDVGEELKVQDQEKVQLSISDLFQMTRGVAVEVADVSKYLSIKSLTEKWRKHFQSLLDES